MIRRLGALTLAILLAGHGVALADTAEPMCIHPRILGVQRLVDAKLLDRAEAQAVVLLNYSDTAPCAAGLLKTISKAKEKAKEEEANQGLVSRAKAKLLKAVGAATDWLAIPMVLGALALMASLLLRTASRIRREHCKPRWRIRSVAKDADPGAVASWRAALLDPQNRGRAALALLVSSGVRLPRALLSGGSADGDSIDIFADAPEIHGLKLSWLRSLLQAWRRVSTSPRRTLAVWATVREQSAMMRIEAIDAKGQLRTATHSIAWSSEDGVAQEIEKMAAAMALRTSYLIADDASSASPGARPFLHEGLERLGAYANGGGVPALTQAVDAFAQTRRVDPGDIAALLYEGVARELLEEHDIAEALFAQAESLGNSETAAVARFNRAISHLRRYNAADLTKAEEQLDQLRQEQLPEGVAAFAAAAQAGALAHNFIFWRHFDPKGDRDFSTWTDPARTDKTRQLRAWSDSIDTLLKEAKKALSAKPFLTDAEAATQLRWMIANAKGNHLLNRAGDAAAAAYGLSQDQCDQDLRQALAAFRECEVLLPPGVETLSNIATTLLRLGREVEAIRYARRAQALNPAYEYAYLREAEAEMQRGRTGAAVKILNAARSKLELVRIPELRALFQKLNVAIDGR